MNVQPLGKSCQNKANNLTVTSTLLEALWITSETLGCSRESLCQKALGEGVARFQHQERFPEAEFIQLLETAIGLTGNPDFGLILGSHTRLGSYSALGYAAMNCQTLGQAFELVPRYEPVVMESGKTQLVTEGARMHLRWRRKGGLACPPVLVDLFFASWVRLAQWMTGKPLHPDGVQLAHSQLSRESSYREFFQSQVHFGCAENELVFGSKEILETRLLEADPQLHAVMVERLDRCFHRQAASLLVTQLSELMCKHLPEGKAALSFYANRLHMSDRTLRRRLAAEGVFFQDILAATRHQLACQYLTGSDLSLLEIALLLGYTEHSSFSAAFKSWQGSTPANFRKLR